MTMIERVAQALGDAGVYDSVRGSERYEELLSEAARAAIEAMREPTWQMLDRASHLADDDTAVQASARTKEAWGLMIDAALAENTDATAG